MDKPTNDAITVFCNLTKGYHAPPTSASTKAWLMQFPTEVRYGLISEMNHICNKYFITEDTFVKRVRCMVRGLDSHVSNKWGQRVYNLDFIPFSNKGESRQIVLNYIEEFVKSEYRVTLSNCTKIAAGVFVDDCIYTGNQCKWNIDKYLKKTPTHGLTHIILSPVIQHEKSVEYVDQWLRAHKRTYHLVSAERYARAKIRNSQSPDDPHSFSCYAPIDTQNAEVQRYIDSQEFNHRTLQGLFRNPQQVIVDKVFSSISARNLVEQQFLIKGAELYNRCDEPKKSSRPMGYQVIGGLGFGTPLVFWRNIPNNSPLVLHWSVKGWCPLFERKHDNVQDIDWVLRDIGGDWS